MNLKGKLNVTNTLKASTTIPKVVNTGGASEWSEIKHKPFETIGLGLTTTVNGELQEAVPVYAETEVIPASERGPGLYFTENDFTFTEDTALEVYFSAPNGFVLHPDEIDGVFTDNASYGFTVKMKDGTVYDGLWAAVDNGEGAYYKYGGWWWYVDDDNASTNDWYEMGIKEEGNDTYHIITRLTQYGALHQNIIFADYDSETGTWISRVDSICLYQVKDRAGYETIEEICADNHLTYSTLTIPEKENIIYHKLPQEYYEAISTAEDMDDWNPNHTIAVKDNGQIKIAGIEGTGDIFISNRFDSFGNPVVTVHADIPDKYISDYVGLPLINRAVALFTSKGNHRYFISKSKIEEKIAGLSEYNNCYILIKCATSNNYQDTSNKLWYAKLNWTNYADASTYTFEGIEGLCSYEYATYNDETGFWFTPRIEDMQLRQVYFYENTGVKQDINAWFIPKDNNTIKVNNQGQLYADVQGGAGSWNDLSNKPFSTVDTTSGLVIYDDTLMIDTLDTIATINYVDQQRDGITNSLSTVAYSGDYEDLINKPTIPAATSVTVTQTLSSGTEIGKIDVDGLTTTLYAPSGSSVTIDNKSIIKNQNDELQEAVPVYSSYESHTYNCFNNWGTLTTYNGEDTSDCAQYIYTTTHANTSKEWKFIINYDYDGNTYQMEGHVNSNTINSMWNQNINIDSNSGPLGSSFRALAVITQGSGSSQLWGCRLQLSGTFPSAINFIVFPEVPYDNTYTASTNVTEETVYKLPTKYTNVKFEGIYSGSYYPVLYEDSTNTIRGVRIGAGTNMSISKNGIWGDSDSQLLTINCNLKPSPIGGLLPTNQGSYGIGTTDVTIDSTHFKVQLNGWSNFYNSWGSGNYYLTFNYCTGNYGDQTYSITGGINCGATVDAVTLDGFEAIVDSVSYDSGTGKLEIYFKENYKHNGSVYIYKTGSAARDIQRVNSYWLPLDNSTIVRDTTNGNIKTVIPACPTTTDGTYTLQATVSNGVVTYSWI